ncbi:MAG: STAS domain-containing protein [Verrucomicrobia bacterium]|nr:STAS domain-containing protein [Verrucomicrobiota bacterium]
MNESKGNIVVGVAGERVFVRVQGKGNYQISQPFCQFSNEIIKRGFHEFVVDLGDCSSMDSTFLGVLAGVGLRLMAASGRIHLANLNSRCREVVASLGIDRLSTVDMCDINLASPGNGGGSAPAPALEPLAMPQSMPTDPEGRARYAEMVIEAHTTLMQIDPQNVPKFKDCVRFLSEDLEKLRAAQKRSNS